MGVQRGSHESSVLMSMKFSLDHRRSSAIAAVIRLTGRRLNLLTCYSVIVSQGSSKLAQRTGPSIVYRDSGYEPQRPTTVEEQFCVIKMAKFSRVA